MTRKQALALGAASLIALAALAFAPVSARGEPFRIRVIDGDTVERAGTVYRLVGFDTAETGKRAKCDAERQLGERAKARLVALIAGGADLAPVACRCRPGTEGTRWCNHGRACATLTVRGRDVGGILISEGLARPYRCGPRSCPARASWCEEP
jgi:endonuclease YncB( thermonuclease family)